MFASGMWTDYQVLLRSRGFSGGLAIHLYLLAGGELFTGFFLVQPGPILRRCYGHSFLLRLLPGVRISSRSIVRGQYARGAKRALSMYFSPSLHLRALCRCSNRLVNVL